MHRMVGNTHGNRNRCAGCGEGNQFSLSHVCVGGPYWPVRVRVGRIARPGKTVVNHSRRYLCVYPNREGSIGNKATVSLKRRGVNVPAQQQRKRTHRNARERGGGRSGIGKCG